MDAIELLKQDHKKVEKIFTDMEKKEARPKLFPELDRELSIHAEIEEKIFYPATKEAEPTRDLVLESIEEHKQIKMVLSDLEKTDNTTEVWGTILICLCSSIDSSTSRSRWCFRTSRRRTTPPRSEST